MKRSRVSIGTLLHEEQFERQKFYKRDRVRLRHFPRKGKGTVTRAALKERGGIEVDWDHGEKGIHNPRFLENVWVDETTGKEEE